MLKKVKNVIKISSLIKYLPVLLTLVTCIMSCSKEDMDSLPQNEIYAKYFGTAREEQMMDMVKRPDGGYLMLASTENTDAGTRDVMLVSTDSAGNKVWERQYDIKGGDDLPGSLRLIDLGNGVSAYIIGTANIDSNDESLFILAVSLVDGEPESQLVYQYLDRRAEDEEEENTGVHVALDPADSASNRLVRTRGADVLLYHDDSSDEDRFIVLGSTLTGPDLLGEANNYTIYLASFVADTYDTTSNWSTLQKNWDEHDGFVSGDDHGVKLLEDNGRYFLLASSVDAGDNQIFVYEFDPESGTEEGEAPRYGNADRSEVPTSFISDQFNLYITGTTGLNREERAFFLRVNKELPDNENIVSLEFPYDANSAESDEGSRGFDVVNLENGDFYVVGQLNNYTNAQDQLKQNEIVMFRVDGFGNIDPQYSRIYGSNEHDAARVALLENNGRSIVIASTVGFGGVATVMSLMKTNANGELKK